MIVSEQTMSLVRNIRLWLSRCEGSEVPDLVQPQVVEKKLDHCPTA